MRAHVIIDLHLEFLPDRIRQHGPMPTIGPAPDADVLILAGDIAKKCNALEAFANWPAPVIYVHGNHEMYGAHMPKQIAALRSATQDTNIHFLERNEVVIDGVRFLGTALWTDFALFGDSAQAMEMAQSFMNDYREIKTHYRTLQPKDTLILHKTARIWLQEQLKTPFDGKSVVVTHMGPHRQSLPAEYQDDILSASYVSDLSELMGKAALWVHGHVHVNRDYIVNGTRIVANPRGYPANKAKLLEDIEWENKEFQPQLVVEI